MLRTLFSYKTLFAIVLCFIVYAGVVFAENSDSTTSTDNSSYRSELEEKIADLEKKLKETQEQENTLTREISSLESQISITEYKITSTNLAIQEKQKEKKLLEDDIEFIENSVVQLEQNIKVQEDVLDKRIREKYKMSRVNQINSFLSNDGFDNLINQIKYAKVAEERDQSLLEEMRETQRSYTLQQGVIETKKQEVQLITQQLEQQKAEAERLKGELSSLKLQKDELLRVTKNNEQNYQELLSAAKKELDQIQGAANIVVRTGNAIDVKKGGSHRYYGKQWFFYRSSSTLLCL